jgi:2-methylaconitate isomerase
MRGGTSKGLVVHREDLPVDQGDWAEIFLAAMGSPDAYGRQLDGMGGGISSLSKVCIVGPATAEGADVDYTFAQIAVDSSLVDYAANCGNMSSAIGPFAVDEGLLSVAPGQATVHINNTNTNTIIRSSFPTNGTNAIVDGDLIIDGVTGTGAPIRLDFLDPGGRKTGHLLPTANASDWIEVRGWGPIEASLVDAGNPCVFVRADVFGLSGTELPEQLARELGVLQALEYIRRAAAVLMGLTSGCAEADVPASVPKIAIVSAPRAARTLSGRQVASYECDIVARMISMGQPHRAIPVTGALCLAVAARIPGSVPQKLATATDGREGAPLRVAHPSGILLVDSVISSDREVPHVRSATMYRTARRLFDGYVWYRTRPR